MCTDTPVHEQTVRVKAEQGDECMARLSGRDTPHVCTSALAHHAQTARLPADKGDECKAREEDAACVHGVHGY